MKSPVKTIALGKYNFHFEQQWTTKAQSTFITRLRSNAVVLIKEHFVLCSMTVF